MKEGRNMATYRMEGNNVVTSYNPTEQEQKACQYLQGQLPSIYQNAIQQKGTTMRSEGYIELKYAPRLCEFFCMGDCCLPGTNRSCGTDKDDCEHYNLYAQLLQLKADNEKLTNNNKELE